jgi:hypothetical protein
MKYDGDAFGGLYNLIFLANTNNHNLFYIPAFTTLTIDIWTGGNEYFDAWYLQDLGVSDGYTQGLDVGYDDGYDVGYDDGFDADAYAIGYSNGLNNNPNILLNGFQAMVGILVNFALMILNLNVFGVSLLNIFGILALFVGLIWILKIVRG